MGLREPAGFLFLPGASLLHETAAMVMVAMMNDDGDGGHDDGDDGDGGDDDCKYDCRGR